MDAYSKQMDGIKTYMESMWNVYGLICSPYGDHVDLLCTPVESTWHPQAVHTEAYGTSIDSMWNEYGTHVARRWAHMEVTRNPYGKYMD
eukprot:9150967-Karenia_brevis.AAC.1